MKKITIFIFLISFLFPCSCLEPRPPQDSYIESDLVFSGEVSSINLSPDNFNYEVAFQVIDIWKGDINNEIIILTGIDSAMCGYDFQVNNKYLVYAYEYSNNFFTDICTRTTNLEYAIEDLKYLNGINSDCDVGFVKIDGDCYFELDINVLDSFIINSQESINMILDINNNGIIEPLELCFQHWEDGRLELLDCNPIIINGEYNWINVSGEIPFEINNLDNIKTLLLPYNELNGFIPESICDLNLDFSNNAVFDISSNNLCPPYPECVEDYVWSQSNWGPDSCELSDCYDVGISDVAVIEVNGDNILNPADDINGVGNILVNMFNDGPSCSQYPGIMITCDTPGINFPFYGSEDSQQFMTFWYAIFSDMTYFSSIEFEISPFIPEGTEINFTIETVTLHCYEDSCSEDPYCHDCPTTPPVLISMVVGESFPNMIGDANIDGSIDIVDIVEIVNYILYVNQEEFNESNQLLFTLININDDYFINILDVMLLVNYILGE